MVLNGLFPRGQEPDTPLRRKIIAVNHELHGAADDSGAVFHDPGTTLLEPDGSMTRRMFYDFCHPNLAGYEAWAQRLLPPGSIL